jgi:LmbE family N-acetylglucosaminyl deacetylase
MPMKNLFTGTLLTSVLLLTACSKKTSLQELKDLSATEVFPDDTFLETVSSKKALVILAHDDDDCAMSGTICKLQERGWQIEQWTLGNNQLAEDRNTHPAEIICDGNHLILKDTEFRNHVADDTLPRYMPVARSKFPALFKSAKVSEALIKKINAYKPSVIFTLDNQIGAYGNPEHVFISQLVLDLFSNDSISAERIYQGVYPNSMEKKIIEVRLTALLKEWGYKNSYLVAREVYGTDGMPEPDVQINIESCADKKMEYLNAYHEDAKKNLRKFIPYYDEFDAETYFAIFDREFFRVIQRNNELHVKASQ